MKPLIKANNGNPIALCNRCFAMMCFVKCVELENCIVIEVRNNGIEDYITTPIGKEPPAYCSKCEKLLSYSLNE